MNGFGLLLGHLLGDYIFQNDWMAKNKTNQHPGKEPHHNLCWISSGTDILGNPAPPHVDSKEQAEQREWFVKKRAYALGHVACAVHCLLYTLCVWICSYAWMPWWGILACFFVHFPVDRWRLARKWMEHISGQKDFANGVFSPWSVIVVDNTFHLLTLYIIALFAGVK